MSTSETAELAREEYRALRATVRERGTLRLIVMFVTFLAWAVLVVRIAPQSETTFPLFACLVVLAAGFEIAFAAHVGVERIGRYLQSHYEGTGAGRPRWEHAIMGFTEPSGPRAHVDPVSTMLFGIAAVLNLASASAALDATGVSLAGLAALASGHALFFWRLIHARRFIRGQRRRDLAVFQSRSPDSDSRI
jgi:hypothetical protein